MDTDNVGAWRAKMSAQDPEDQAVQDQAVQDEVNQRIARALEKIQDNVRELFFAYGEFGVAGGGEYEMVVGDVLRVLYGNADDQEVASSMARQFFIGFGEFAACRVAPPCWAGGNPETIVINRDCAGFPKLKNADGKESSIAVSVEIRIIPKPERLPERGGADTKGADHETHL